MKLMYVRKSIISIFGLLGRFIGRHPLFFVLVPLIISAILSVGFIKMKKKETLEDITNADRGNFFKNKQYIEKMFPMNTSELFNIEKSTGIPKYPVVEFVSRKGGNMLEKDILNEIEAFDKFAKNISIVADGKLVNYSEICAIVLDRCFENPIFYLLSHLDDVISQRLRFKYPFEIDPVTFVVREFVTNFGGVQRDKNGYVLQANAIRLVYPLDESDVSKHQWIKKWLMKFTNSIKNYKFHHVDSFPGPLLETELEIKQIAQNTLPLIGIAAVIISILCIISFITNNCMKSKPWLGIAVVVSAGLATISAFGLMAIFGIEYTHLNIALPFLIIAIEVDDAFVMVACWKGTDPGASVESRMGETYSNAAVSITLTSITNILSYCIALTAAFPSIRIFCSYAAASTFFAYIFQITFFGAWLAFSGYREDKGVHPFLFKSDSENIQNLNSDRNILMNFFGDNFTQFISHPISKSIIILVFFFNLAIGIWGVMSLNEGLNVLVIFPQNSEITAAYRIYYKYFTEYTYPLHIVFNTTLDYSNLEVQKSIEDLMTKFKSHPNIAGSDLEFSWLKYFKIFQKTAVSKYLLSGYDLSQKQDFINALKDVFFKIGPAKQLRNDVVFNENYTEIISSRFFLIATNISDRITEIKFFNDMQKIEEKSPFPIIIHSFVSASAEQGIIIRKITFQLFWLTALLSFLVLFVFIPNFKCTLLVAVCVASIAVETVGYMTLWDINLDLISLLVLIICMGFCINYPTHITYGFLSSPNNTIKDKLKDCMYHVGYPIIQGTMTTILGPLIVLYTNLYIYTIFVKIIIITALQTAFHALFVIPVVLSILYSCQQTKAVNEQNDQDYNLVL